MIITTVIKEDVSDLKRISREAVNRSVEADVLVKREIILDTDNRVELNVESDDCVFLKYESNPATGFILVQKYWNLSDLFVVPEKQGEGIGSMLLGKALFVCESKNNVGYIRVNSSKNAEIFYRKHGFQTFVPQKKLPQFIVPLVYHF